MTKLETTGIILAGGYSSRFGSDKAVAKLDGVSLMNHTAQRLGEVCATLIAVARPNQDTNGWPTVRLVIDDEEMPEGPLRGIYAGLNVCTTQWAFAVACDAPLVRPELLRFLLRHIKPEVQAVVTRWDGHLQPLVALYSVSCVDIFLQLLKAGERSPRRALESIPHTVVDEDEWRSFDPEGTSFVNVNTAEDLHRLTATPPLHERT
jgi:molybdenum cofactor guanylyltransferase